MHNLIQNYQKVRGGLDSPTATGSSKPSFYIILDNLKTKQKDMESLLSKKKLNYEKIEILSFENSV